MKATELMIGDWVICYNPSHRCDEPGIIRAIQPREGDAYPSTFDVYLPLDEGGLCFARQNQVKPIPLTAEILEKNIPFNRNWDATSSNPQGSVAEWRKDNDMASVFVWDFRDKIGEYILEINIKGWVNYGIKKNIYFVHELQHALRLCGLNELADNLRIE